MATVLSSGNGGALTYWALPSRPSSSPAKATNTRRRRDGSWLAIRRRAISMTPDDARRVVVGPVVDLTIARRSAASHVIVMGTDHDRLVGQGPRALQHSDDILHAIAGLHDTRLALGLSSLSSPGCGASGPGRSAARASPGRFPASAEHRSKTLRRQKKTGMAAPSSGRPASRKSTSSSASASAACRRLDYRLGQFRQLGLGLLDRVVRTRSVSCLNSSTAAVSLSTACAMLSAAACGACWSS